MGLSPDLELDRAGGRLVHDSHRVLFRVDGKTLGGQALISMGLPVRLRGDYDSAVFELTAK